MINYKGVFITKLEDAITFNPNMDLATILMGFLNKRQLNGKHFFDCSDEEIYASLETFLLDIATEDEMLTEEEFKDWMDGHTKK